MRLLPLLRQSVFICVFCLTAPACIADTPAGMTQIRFELLDNFQIVVPVTLNDVGSFYFLLDTGTSRSMVRSRIANRLALPLSGHSTIAGLATATPVALVKVESVTLGRAAVRKLQLTVLPKTSLLPPKFDGVLGEDFLENFDVLIDYRHRSLQLQSGGDSLANSLSGERLTVQLESIQNGEPTFGRLIINGRMAEAGDGNITLQLDSGTGILIWLRGSRALGLVQPTSYSVSSVTGQVTFSATEARSIHQLQLGRKVVLNLVALAPPVRIPADTDGLLPTCLFQSIFISHAQKFVILEPSHRPLECARSPKAVAKCVVFEPFDFSNAARLLECRTPNEALDLAAAIVVGEGLERPQLADRVAKSARKAWFVQFRSISPLVIVS
jgi:hypothetical protein